jgi:tetratricopeptide (TPR) repeat protein
MSSEFFIVTGILIALVSVVGWLLGRRARRMDEDGFEEEVAAYDSIITGDAESASDFYERGHAFLIKGDVEAAIADFTRALELNPDYYQVYHDRADAYHRKGDLDGAIDDLTLALEDAPYPGQIFAARAALYLEKEDYDAAITDYERAIAADPRQTVSGTLSIGMVHIAKGDFDTAIETFDSIIKVHPRPASAYNGRGIVHLKRGDLTLAAADFEKALEIDRDYAIACANLGIVLFRMGDAETAAEIWEEAVEDLPDAPDYAYAGYAIALWKLDRKSEALDPYRAAIEWDERWRDDVEDIATEINWTDTMTALAKEIIDAL